ncbi:MAG TPA: hypothetical protein PKD45_09475 [Flavobacteriales bacterium]|nr:hypothetical protein [Flavobacteriales bacterium]
MGPFGEELRDFLIAAQQHGLRVLLVDGGAVNFHGYQRQSADIDLWVDPTPANFDRLLATLKSLGYSLEELPEAVIRQEQNISINLSPDLELELITRFDPGKSFEEAWAASELTELAGEPVAINRVLGFDDLVSSKVRAGRPKDLLDIQELQRRRR